MNQTTHATNNCNQTRGLTFDDAEFWKLVGGNRAGGRKKVRADAILKNLSPQAQARVMEWACKPLARNSSGTIVGGSGGVVCAVRELEAVAEKFGRPELAVSAKTVSRFVNWSKEREERETGGEYALGDTQDSDAVGEEREARTGELPAVQGFLTTQTCGS